MPAEASNFFAAQHSSADECDDRSRFAGAGWAVNDRDVAGGKSKSVAACRDGSRPSAIASGRTASNRGCRGAPKREPRSAEHDLPEFPEPAVRLLTSAGLRVCHPAKPRRRKIEIELTAGDRMLACDLNRPATRRADHAASHAAVRRFVLLFRWRDDERPADARSRSKQFNVRLRFTNVKRCRPARPSDGSTARSIIVPPLFRLFRGCASGGVRPDTWASAADSKSIQWWKRLK